MKRKKLKFLFSVCLLIFIMAAGPHAFAQIEDRTPTGGANIITRKCIGGANAGTRCNNDSDCDSANCFEYNIIDLTVNLKSSTGGWTPTADQMATIQGYFTAINDTIADVTDGQMALGTISLIVDNDAPNAVIQFTAGTCNTGGGPCLTDANCAGVDTCIGAGGTTNAGGWGVNGKINVGPVCLQNPLCFTHEFMHLIAQVYDEYEGAVDDGIDNDLDGDIDECKENQSKSRCFGGANDTLSCDCPGGICQNRCLHGANDFLPCTVDGDCPGGTCETRCFGGMDNGFICDIAADCPGGDCRRIVCIDPGPPADPDTVAGCLMRCCRLQTDSDLCFSVNHDPDVDTEQSQCQDDRSCWEQFGLEWPSVIEVPVGAPDPGPATSPTTVGFLTPSILDRFVAVIDRSDSMSLETPQRIDVAVTATKDFIDLLSDGTEFGLASFSSAEPSSDPPDVDSTKDFPPEAGLRALDSITDRNDAKTEVDNLTGRLGGHTRIGAGLREAHSMLLEAGGTITLNTAVLLLTDGLNNRPSADPNGDLDDALHDLSDAGIPVFVTCIGEARDSVQCSHIADQTAGRYVDSAETESLYDAFIEFAAEAQAQEISSSEIGTPISAGDTTAPIPALIEDGVEEVRFVISWTKATSDLDLLLFDPHGIQVPVTSKTEASQGEFYLIQTPQSGIWTMRVSGTSIPDPPEKFSVRSIVRNKGLNVEAGLAKSTIEYPKGFLISANPSMGLSITGCQVSALVAYPDGSTDICYLKDDGKYPDTDKGDGLYMAEFKNFTAGDGIYTFTVSVSCDDPRFYQDHEPGIGQFPVVPQIGPFKRIIRFSGAVTGVPDNLPPVADICNDVRAECQGAVTPIELDGTCSSDPEGEALSYQWSSLDGSFDDPTAAMPIGNFPLGYYEVSLVVTDPEGASSAPDKGRVVIADTTSPEITCPSDITEEQTSASGTPVNLGTPNVYEICDVDPIVTNNAPSVFPLGTTTVTWTVTDFTGNSSSCTQTVTVVDTTPPVIINVSASPNTLWPPDHKMIPVTVTCESEDICDIAPVCRIISVESNQPVDACGDGNTEPDWEITGDMSLNLRAERAGCLKEDRVYTITVECTDFSGNSSHATVNVIVTHDQGKDSSKSNQGKSSKSPKYSTNVVLPTLATQGISITPHYQGIIQPAVQGAGILPVYGTQYPISVNVDKGQGIKADQSNPGNSNKPFNYNASSIFSLFGQGSGIFPPFGLSHLTIGNASPSFYMGNHWGWNLNVFRPQTNSNFGFSFNTPYWVPPNVIVTPFPGHGNISHLFH